MFSHIMYKNGCLYSGTRIAQSALSSVVMIEAYGKLSSHPLINRFLKEIFNRYPPLPKDTNIWDINTLLSHYDKMPPNGELDFKCLYKKLIILLLILGARRKQTLTSIAVENVILNHYKAILLLNKTLTHSAPNQPLKPFAYHSYK